VLLIGRPLFPGKDSVEQLVEIMQRLGTPSREDVESMNRSYAEVKFTNVVLISWDKTFPSTAPVDIINLIAQMLAYSPAKRIKPLVACTNVAFAELRSAKTTLPNGQPLPPLFNFTELELSVDPSLNEALLHRTA